jgi:Gluconate 2-dehydrogenase subunit 3
MWFKSREAGSMPSEHDESRRAFLVGAVIGAGAAGVGFAPEAGAQTNDQQAAASATTGQAHAHGPGHGAFFNDDDAATVAAFAERLMPGASESPGARDANVLNYIDLALAGSYSDLQDFYRRGLSALDAYCHKTHNAPFVQLDAAKQDEVITALEQNKASGSPGRPQLLSSTPCACTPWRVCLRTRSTAETKTLQVGAWWAGRPREQRGVRRWRADRPAGASPSRKG